MNGVVEIVRANVQPLARGDVSLPAVTINPMLIITNDSGSIKLQWPMSASDCMLEATTNLTELFSMFGYSETTNAESGMISVLITNSSPQMFFRLHKP